MIILDTSKCAMKIDFSCGRRIRRNNDDYLRLEYKGSSLFIRPHPRQIEITGDISTMALGIALLIQGTLETLDHTNIIDDAFTFSKEGHINGYWIVENLEPIKEFVEIYNRIYPTVLLLKD